MTLRLGLGGRQQAVCVAPDLTTMGKLIGGGLPIGAVGGSAETMEVTIGSSTIGVGVTQRPVRG